MRIGYASLTLGVRETNFRTCIESFHALLKKECVYLYTFIDYNHAKLVLFQYLEGFYNKKRIHSSINYMTPDNFEQICRAA